MFRLSHDVIESDEGFTVQILGRGRLRYCEPPRCVYVDTEFLVGPSGMVVYSRSIRRWEPPHAHEPIDDVKRAAIVANLRRALAFRGYDIEVD
ncbi:MAG TPA: Imm74 family immunity protein [Candidatus Binatia bacterium]|nr:Imm74 family immunity protein [Candidatus Binatia bacterium]